MENRGQKRTEIVDQMPADKRACSARPSSSNSSVQTPINSENATAEVIDGDMETSSSASGSIRSEGDVERDSYGSCESDDFGDDPRMSNLRDYQTRRSFCDHGKFKRVLTILGEETDQSGLVAALTELCEMLSFCTDSMLSSLMVDSISPLLVKLASHESNPDIMLLAIRAITYLCDVHPRSSGFLVRHDVVHALCQRLLAIEYMDVAEQCLQALQKISQEQPLACFQSGAIMAVLNYIDFFSTSLQRVALSTVVNICKKLPSESPSLFMDAVPVLCNLLQYEDVQLVEHATTCLIKITERICQSSDKLDNLCKHGLIHQATHLLDLNSRTTISQPTYTGLIGLLVKFSCGSILAVQTLYELNISSILKDILSAYGLLHGMPSPNSSDGRSNQVNEVLKLLNELLPSIARDQEDRLAMDKKVFLENSPDLLQKFGIDILPVIIQVVNSGANSHVCYGCLLVINNIVNISKSGTLIDLLKNTNISSFLAGVFARKDHHVLVLGLQISDTILQKLPNAFLGSFVKEGVLFAIDALLVPEKCSQSMVPVPSSIELPNDPGRCLCYAFHSGQLLPSAETGSCKLPEDSVHIHAYHIKNSYFTTEFFTSEKGLTDVLKKLKMLSTSLTDLVNMALDDDSLFEEDFYCVLSHVIELLNGRDHISTFEFVESGIVKSLVNYLSNGKRVSDHIVVEKRFELFGKVLLSTFSVLIQKLQSALSSVENFPLILSSYKQKNSYATVPSGRCMTRPCLRVQFLRDKGETCLCDYSKEVLTVDPCASLDDVEGFLWPKVSKNIGKEIKSSSDTSNKMENASSQIPSKVESPREKTQVDAPNSSNSSSPDGAVQTTGSSKTHVDRAYQDDDCSDEDASNLLFYLEGQLLDRSMSLYQAIIQLDIKSEQEIVSNAKIWNQVYKVTYRRADAQSKQICHQADDSSQLDNYIQIFSSLSFLELAPGMEKTSPSSDMLFLLQSLESINRFWFHLLSRERVHTFAIGKINKLDDLKVVTVSAAVPQNEFVNNKLTEKLEQQLQDPLAVSVGGMPSWCQQLMESCPFVFSFEARCKFFRLSAFGQVQENHPSSLHGTEGPNGRRHSTGGLRRKKFLVSRENILESAAQMMDLHAHQNVVLEVEYKDEVGTGLGPTLEFYTLVSREFQKSGLGMWRDDHMLDSGIAGLFPRPWSSTMSTSNGVEFSEVLKKYVLLGQVVAKALQDGRVLDLPFSKAFYRLILGQELTLYDIHSFDPELGKTLLEFHALVEKEKHLKSFRGGKSTIELDPCFHDTRIEDLCLDFTLPGYPDYVFTSEHDDKMVNINNLEEYVSYVVDATVDSGILRQIEAFESGFNQVFPIDHLEVFKEEELERILCGERELWTSNEILDHIKFDHGYTASSPPIINLLEVIREFDHQEQRAFLQFVTGAPQLPRGGLASLNPKLTIVRKQTSVHVDADLPSVMTCANYLKLPPYSSKERMKEKILFAITEGQGSFHLS